MWGRKWRAIFLYADSQIDDKILLVVLFVCSKACQKTGNERRKNHVSYLREGECIMVELGDQPA